MAKISLLFVEKLVNSSLLTTLPALISKILSNFSLAPDSCKGLFVILIYSLTLKLTKPPKEHLNFSECIQLFL